MGSRQAVIPGMRICAAEDHYQPGLGTYILHGYIYASLVGRLRLVSSKGRFLHLESCMRFINTLWRGVVDSVTGSEKIHDDFLTPKSGH